MTYLGSRLSRLSTAEPVPGAGPGSTTAGRTEGGGRDETELAKRTRSATVTGWRWPASVTTAPT